MPALSPLAPIGTDLWSVARPFRAWGLDIGGRMTVVRLPSGDLLLHSPVPLDTELRRALEALGPVGQIVAPNLFHHLFLGEHVAAFPNAALWGPPKLARKRADLRFAGELGDVPPPAWGGAIDTQLVLGVPAFREVALLHRPTRTLLLADHLFCFEAGAPFLTRLAGRVIGAYERPSWPGATLLRLVRDRAALRASIDRLLEWDFERIVVCHDAVIETGGREALRRAYASYG